MNPLSYNSNKIGRQGSVSGLKGISGNTPHIINIRLAGIINFLSESARELIQQHLKVGIVSGENCLKVLPYSILSGFVGEIKHVISSKLPNTFSYTFKDLKYIISIVPVFASSGKTEQIQVLIFPDHNSDFDKVRFQPKKENELLEFNQYLKSYEDRINAVLESITDGFFLLNDSGVVIYYNKAAGQLLKIPREKVLNRKFKELFPVEENSAIYQKYLEACTSKQKNSFEFYSQYLGKWFDMNIYPGRSH